MTSESYPTHAKRGSHKQYFLLVAAIVLGLGGAIAVGVALIGQHHAPQPPAAVLGRIPAQQTQATKTVSPFRSVSTRSGSAPSRVVVPSSTVASPLQLLPSTPVSISIPALGIHSNLLQLGLNSNGTVQVPPLYAVPSEAGWYSGSPSPGQIGPSVILGHIDTYKGPSVFYNLGAAKPGDTVDIKLADGVVGVFRINAVASYPKATFPSPSIYGPTNYAALRLITCGGTFDYSTRQYLSSTVVYATLMSDHKAL